MKDISVFEIDEMIKTENEKTQIIEKQKHKIEEEMLMKFCYTLLYYLEIIQNAGHRLSYKGKFIYRWNFKDPYSGFFYGLKCKPWNHDHGEWIARDIYKKHGIDGLLEVNKKAREKATWYLKISDIAQKELDLAEANKEIFMDAIF